MGFLPRRTYMTSIRPGMQLSVLIPPAAETSFAARAQRISAHSLRARIRSARVRLFSQAVIAKGRVLRAKLASRGSGIA